MNAKGHKSICKILGQRKKNQTASVVFYSLITQKKEKYRFKLWTISNATMCNIWIFDNFCGFGIKRCNGGHGTLGQHYYCYHHIVTTNPFTRIVSTQGTAKPQYRNLCS